MPIFRKKATSESEEDTAPAEGAAADTKGVSELEKEQAVLDQYFDDDSGEPTVPDTPTDPVTPMEEPQQAADDGAANLSADLMDIFSSEEVEDEDLSALTQDLHQIGSASLLDLGREILELLMVRNAESE